MSSRDRWPLLPLNEVTLNLQQGFARSPNDDTAGIPHLRPNNISSNGMLNLSDIKYVHATRQDLDKFGIQKGDIIFNNTNSIELVGKTAYFDKEIDSVISNHLTRIRANPEFLNAEFLAFYLHYLWQKGISRSLAKQWVNQAAIDSSSLSQIKVLVLPLAEQKYIVDVLHQANILRNTRCKISKCIEELYLSLFFSTFGNPETNPNKWRVVPLAKAGHLERGRSQHRPRDAPHLYGGSYPFIQTGDVAVSNGLITRYNRTYSEAGLAQSRLWPKGTLCITIAANIAKTGILAFESCFPDSIVGFIPGKDVDVEYVHQWFRINQGRIEEMAPQVAQKNININILSNLLIPLPTLSLQEDFAEKVAQIRSIAGLQNKVSRRLEDLYQSLIEQAFSGQLTRIWKIRMRIEDNRDGFTTLANEQEEKVVEVDQTRRNTYRLIESLENNLIEQDVLEISEDVQMEIVQIIKAIIEPTDLLRRNIILNLLSKSKRIIKVLIDGNLGNEDRMDNICKIISGLPDSNHPRSYLLQDLSDEQYLLYLSTLIFPEDYFTPENLVEDTGQALASVRQSLELMTAVGLLVHVCLPTKSIGGLASYVPVYRVHHFKDENRHGAILSLNEAF